MAKKRRKFSKVNAEMALAKREINIAEKNIGHLAFIAGVIVAIIAGVATNILDKSVVTLVLVILGVVVGFMNITKTETTGFIVAALALMVAGVANVTEIPWLGQYLQAILINIGTFVGPAAVVVALKQIYRLAED